MCREAAIELRETFISDIQDEETFPAGCYLKLLSDSREIYFNKITDATLTKPEKFNKRGGVCKAGMESSITLLYLLKKILPSS